MDTKQSKRRPLGFTLIELMIVLGLAAVILMFAAPGFVHTIQTNRLQTQSNEFLRSLMTARSEALKRNIPVQMCKNGGGAACETASGIYWEEGWIIYADTNGDGNVDDAERIGSSTGIPSSYTLRAGSSGYDDVVTFLPDGTVGGAGVTFNLCIPDAGGDTDMSRGVEISRTGRPRILENASTCPS